MNLNVKKDILKNLKVFVYLAKMQKEDVLPVIMKLIILKITLAKKEKDLFNAINVIKALQNQKLVMIAFPVAPIAMNVKEVKNFMKNIIQP